MNQNEELSQELLKENGIKADLLSDGYRSDIQRMIKKEKISSMLLKWATIFWWTVVVIIHISYMINVGAILDNLDNPSRIDHYGENVYLLGTIEPFLILAGAILTMVFLMRLRTISILEIQGRLASIEEQMRQLANR
ncbi:MAG: hypothetical protein ABIH23_20030 [bacterium]